MADAVNIAQPRQPRRWGPEKRPEAPGGRVGTLGARRAPGALAPVLVLAFVIALAGCGTAPPSPPPEPAAPAPPAPRHDPRPAAAAALAARAAAAEAEARWLDAVSLREAVRLLKPDDPEAIDASARARQRRDAEVAEALARARGLLRDGDSPAAQRQFLQVLAWSPGHPAALQALQLLERQRAERQPRRFAPDPALRLPAGR